MGPKLLEMKEHYGHQGTSLQRATVKDIVEFAETQVDLNSYLPDFEYN